MACVDAGAELRATRTASSLEMRRYVVASRFSGSGPEAAVMAPWLMSTPAPHLLVARGADGGSEVIGQTRAGLGVSVDGRLHRLQRHLARPPQRRRSEIQVRLIQGEAARQAGAVRGGGRHKAGMQGGRGQLAGVAQRQAWRLRPLGV